MLSNKPNITTPPSGSGSNARVLAFSVPELLDPDSIADPERRAQAEAILAQPKVERPPLTPEQIRDDDEAFEAFEQWFEDHKLAILARVRASTEYQKLHARVVEHLRLDKPLTVEYGKGIDLEFAKLLAPETARDEADQRPVFSYVEDLLREHGFFRREGTPLADERYLVWTTELALLACPRIPPVTALNDEALEDLPEPTWRLDGILPADSGVVLYGRRSTYKTFLLLDWGLSIQTGLDWLGHAVAPGQFVYVAAEGWGGLKQRVKAWKLGHGVEDTVGACFVKGSTLRTDAAVERLIGRIQTQVGTAPVALIGLDTLNRLIPGIEENSPEAMGRAVGIADRLRAAFPGATVVWVHHSGWDDQHERGHSSLGDDLDVIMHAEEALEPRTVELTCEKQKDADEFSPIRFTAVAAAESLVLEAAAAAGAGPGATLNETQAALLSVLVGASPGGEYVLLPAWFGACVALPVRVRGKVIERRTFNHNRQELLNKGRVEGDKERGFRPVVLPPQPQG